MMTEIHYKKDQVSKQEEGDKAKKLDQMNHDAIVPSVLIKIPQARMLMLGHKDKLNMVAKTYTTDQ